MGAANAVTVEGAKTVPLWVDRAGLKPTRAAVKADIDVDVAIVGAGFSGLWTAWYLRENAPHLSVAVIEREYCGFGASGRNGGWCVGELAGSAAKYAKRSSHAEALRLERAMMATVDEVGRVVDAQSIDCGYAKGGVIRVARTGPQAARQADEVAHAHANGFTEHDIRLLSAAEAESHLNATKVRGGIFFAPCASVDPARLVVGLAAAVERAGGHIYESTAVTAIGDGYVETDAGHRIRAASIVRATEAYTRDLAGARRDLLPVYSLMIATEPLPESIFDEIGLEGRPTFADDRHMVIYGQRTEDNRLAFGGRGVPYLFGSAIANKAEFHQPSHQLIAETLVDLLPVLGDVRITHRWGGVLAIPRDWVPGLRYDRKTGRGVLGGYVGEGVAAANLAGQTMADLVIGADTSRTSLPWVGVHPRRWEPEPLRWLGVRGSRRVLVGADAREEKTDKPAKVALKLSRLLRGA